MTEEDFLNEVRETFEYAAEREEANRRRAEDDLRFTLFLEQWPEQVRRQRELEGRPCLTIDRLNPFIKQVVNSARQNKPGITVHPADSGADVETAEIYEGIIRNIEVTSSADIAYDTGVDRAVRMNIGYIRVNTKYARDDSFDQDIVIEPVRNPLTIYGDPDADDADGSGWNVAHEVETIRKKEFERRYGKDKGVAWSADGYTGLKSPWIDDDSVMVVRYWKREEVMRTIVMTAPDGVVRTLEEAEAEGLEIVGEPRDVPSYRVTHTLCSGAEVLEKTREWPGQFIPIAPVYGEDVDYKGERVLKSLIHNAKDSQVQFNFYETTATETIAMAPRMPFMGEEGVFDADIEKWSNINNSTVPFVQFTKNMQPPQRQPLPQTPTAELTMALRSSDNIKATLGMYDASLGQRSNETSGVAINARRAEGDTTSFDFTDNLTRAIRHVGRIIIDLIPKVYSQERVLRILGKDMKPQMVKVAPGGGEQIDPQTQAVTRIYDLTAGKYDLVVKAGPSFSTQREEAQASLVEIIRAYPASAQLLGPLVLRNSDWPGADEAADKLEGKGDEQEMVPKAEAQAVVQQGMQQIGQLNEQLVAAQNEAALKQAELQIKAREIAVKEQEAQIDFYRAQTERVQAENPPPPTGFPRAA